MPPCPSLQATARPYRGFGRRWRCRCAGQSAATHGGAPAAATRCPLRCRSRARAEAVATACARLWRTRDLCTRAAYARRPALPGGQRIACAQLAATARGRSTSECLPRGDGIGLIIRQAREEWGVARAVDGRKGVLEGRRRTVAELRVMVEVPAGMRPGPPLSQPKQIKQPQLVRARARATEQPDERRAVG